MTVEHVLLLSLSQSLTIDEERRHAVNMGRQRAISFQDGCVKWQGFCDAVLDCDIDVVPEMGQEGCDGMAPLLYIQPPSRGWI